MDHYFLVFEDKLSSHKNKKRSTTKPNTKTTINKKLTILYKMNYFNLKHFLLSTILVTGNNVEAAESQLRGSDERKLQNNCLAGQYLLDAVNTRNTQPYYPQWDYYGDDFIAYKTTASSSSGDGPYYHSTTITWTDPNNNCQTCRFDFAMNLDPLAVGGYVWIDASIRWNPNTGKAEVTNVRTNTNNIGERTEAIMNALRTTDYIELFNAVGVGYPNFYGDTRKQNQGGNDLLIPDVNNNGQVWSQSQLSFSPEGQWTNDDFIAYKQPTGVDDSGI
jgi:hypothetical protein